jgi:hypothetical protein
MIRILHSKHSGIYYLTETIGESEINIETDRFCDLFDSLEYMRLKIKKEALEK